MEKHPVENEPTEVQPSGSHSQQSTRSLSRRFYFWRSARGGQHEVQKPAGHYWLLLLKGMCMGAADVVPGVSGGTIAFITGIYEELIESLKSINFKTLKTLFRQGVAPAWQAINGNFLLAVFGGIGISLLTLSHLITYCLTHYPIQVWAFFFGLIAASIIHMLKQTSAWRWKDGVAFLMGAAFAIALSLAEPAHWSADSWSLFAAGAIAICAMILPGISGSFILLILGLYSVFLNALKEFNLLALSSFAGGCIFGLLAFSHVLSWLLKRFHTTVFALLTGILLGSLNSIWPWKHVLETTVDRHGKLRPLVQENIMPWSYQQLTGQESYWLAAMLIALLAVVIVLALERLAPSEKKN